MRKIIASAQVSLDGVMQGQGSAQEDTSDGFDLGGWSMKFSDAKTGAAIMGVVGTPDKPYDLLLGRKTYDIFASYWPYVRADNPIGPVFTKAKTIPYWAGPGKIGTGPTATRCATLMTCGRSRRAMVRTLCCGAVQPSIRSCWKRISLTGFYCLACSDSSWKRQKTLRQHLAPREHEAG